MKHNSQEKDWILLTGMILLLLSIGNRLAFGNPPQTINIRGQLLDASGQALSGVREYRVQFYDAAADGTPLGEAITGQADLSPEGLFNLQIVLPSQALLAPEAWYELAVSSGAVPGPLTGSDIFPDRVKVESVPFALQSAEANHVEVPAVGSGIVTDSEFNALSGVTSGIQNQLDAKANTIDVYLKTEVDLLQAVQDAAIADKANTADVVAKAGDTMTGALVMSGAPVTVTNSYVELGQSTAPGTVADKLYNIDGALQWNGAPAYRFPWAIVTTDTQMAGNNGYMASSGNLVTLTLPLSASLNVGDTVRVNGIGAGGWEIAQNALQSILVGALQIPNASGAWIPRESNRNWFAVASSADGERLAACVSGGQIYLSADGGMTWTPRANMWGWMSIASSASGDTLVASASTAPLYVSTDAGLTWTTHGSSLFWQGVAASADGTKLFATAAYAGGAYLGGVYVSTDQGATWTPRGSSTSFWRDVACSADGTKVVACVANNGVLYTSTDSGTSWTPRESPRFWEAVASSADGTNLVACVYSGAIYTSTDSGVTWTPRTPNNLWGDVAMSADGTKIVACAYSDAIYTSTDSGATWSNSLSGSFRSVTSSADGKRLAACKNEDRIYTYSDILSQTMPGTSGGLSGGRNTAVELQYVGNDSFVPISHEGALGAF